MAAFFGTQLDYIYFFYGLAFLVMAQTCFSINEEDGNGLPWKWLGLFGIFHGAHEWLHLAALGYGGAHPSLNSASTVVSVISYVFLLEFGRSGLRAVRGIGPGRWALLPLAGAAFLGLTFGLPGLDATSRYFLGLPGGVLTAFAMWEAEKSATGRAKAALAVAGVSMAAYALATAVVPDSPFPPASVFNESVFLGIFHVPVQLVRGVLAMAVAAALSVYNIHACRSGEGGRAACPYAAAAIVAVVLAGWALTGEAGKHAEDHMRRELLFSVANLAGTINPERLERIAAGAQGADGPDRARIQEQVESVCRSYCAAEHGLSKDEDGRYCVHVHVRMAMAGVMTVVAGTRGVAGPAPGFGMDDYRSGALSIVGPYTDQYGGWITAVAPVVDAKTGKILAQVVMETDSSSWVREINGHRLYGILLSFALSMLTLAFMVAWQRTKESAARGEELKLASLRLDNEKKLKEITSALGEGVYVLDGAGRLTFMNPEAERLLGWSEAELLGRDMHEAVHFMNEDGSHKGRDECPALLTMNTGVSVTVEGDVFVGKDGIPFPVSYVAAPRFEDGVISGTVTAFRDITERKKADDRLRLLQAAVEAAPDGVQIVGMDGRVIYSNAAFGNMLGYPPADAAGMHVAIFHAGLEEQKGEVARVTAETGGWTGETKLRHKDGRELDAWLSTSVVKDGAGHPIAMVGVSKDVTELRRAEDIVRNISEGVSAETGEEFYRSLAGHLAKNLGVAYAFIGELTDEGMTAIRTKAVHALGSIADNFSYELAGTPCENVVGKGLCSYPRDIQALFPEDVMLVQMEAESYVGTPLFDSSGRPLGILAVLDTQANEEEEFTTSVLRIFAARASAEMERQQAYDRLRKNQERLAAAELVAHFGSWEWSVPEDRVYWSDGLCRIFGIEQDEFDGTYQAFLDFVHPDDRQSVMDQVLLSATTFRPLEYEARIVRKDGVVRVIHVQGEVTLGADGTPSSLLGTVQDITERSAAEGETRKFRFIVDGAGEEINLVDKGANIVYANPASLASLGYTLEEITRLRISDIDPEFDETRWPGHFADLKAGDMPLFESTHVAKDGRAIPVEIKSVYMDIGGEGYICGFVRDITDRKALERQRADFYAMITHDLKSPLTVILGYADMMLEDGREIPGRDVRDMAASIRASGMKLYRMVDDFLAISRLEAGKATFNECPVDVSEMLSEVAAETAALARSNGKSFRADIEKGLPMSVMDKTHVYRAVSNLVQNGVNYTAAGGNITLNASRFAEDGSEYIRITVSDDGPGIPPDERDKVFEKYYRSPKTSGTRGSGLGLAVVKAVAAVHGGYVELKTEEGKGSEFSLVLPVRKEL